MQTFLPYAEYEKSAACLDRQRLGKQRIEVLALLNATSDHEHRLFKHPATRMWLGHKDALAAYGLAICAEWVRRGYLDTVGDQIRSRITPGVEPRYAWLRERGLLPRWDGSQKLIDSHRSNLLRKDPVYYGVFGWCVPVGLPYHWPVVLFNFEDTVRRLGK